MGLSSSQLRVACTSLWPLLYLSALIHASADASSSSDGAKPLKVFILAGQSNMVGMGSIDHLDILVNDNESDDSNEFRDALWNGTAYKTRDDVYIKFDKKHGPLTVGRDSGYAGKKSFGPELMFGWTVGDAMVNEDEKVLLIKTAWGGKSLAVDFRPPASGQGNYSGVKPIHYGWLYREMVMDVLDTLDDLSAYVPDYDEDAGYDLAGFVWFQGWNDMLNMGCVLEYGPNLVDFIHDVRLDLETPNLPFIIGELGMHGLYPKGKGSDRVLRMRASEHSVTVMDEFRNNTLFVRTAPYAVLNDTCYNGIYHYNGRADTYLHIGQAFGKGMLQLMNLHGKMNRI